MQHFLFISDRWNFGSEKLVPQETRLLLVQIKEGLANGDSFNRGVLFQSRASHDASLGVCSCIIHVAIVLGPLKWDAKETKNYSQNQVHYMDIGTASHFTLLYNLSQCWAPSDFTEAMTSGKIWFWIWTWGLPTPNSDALTIRLLNEKQSGRFVSLVKSVRQLQLWASV